MSDRIDATMRTLRRITTALRPAVLDDLGFLAAVEWQAREFQERTGITCELASPQEDIWLEPARAIAMFRILQEALTNVARHSGAKRVRVGLRVDGDHLALEVEDDGRGIAPEAVSGATSFGLLGMRERAVAFGGAVTVTRGREGGTTVAARIPLSAQNEEENT